MNNLIDRFNLEVSRYIKEISDEPNVVGIILTGSAGRGDYDAYSDIDNVVVVNGYHKIKEGKYARGELLFDTRVVDINILEGVWSEDMYFAYLSSKIIYDPEGLIKKIYISKAILWKNICQKKLFISLVNLSVVYEFSDNWQHLQTKTHYQKFIEREDYLSAHRLLNTAIEIILEIVYLLHSLPPPDSKNRVRQLNKLSNITIDFIERLKNAYVVESFNKEDVERRYNLLHPLIKDIKVIVEKEFKLPGNLYEYYLVERD